MFGNAFNAIGGLMAGSESSFYELGVNPSTLLVLEHVIIGGDGRYFSFADENLL